MKIKLTVVVLLVVAAAFFQCKKSGDDKPKASFSCADSPITCDLTASNGLFAIDLFKQIQEEEPDSNIFISPFSISTALTMTANGAVGMTLEDMRSALRITGLNMPSVNDAYQQLLKVLPSLDPKTKLKLANSIWTQKGTPVLPSFLSVNQDYYHSEVIPIDSKDPTAVKQVNNWIENNTEGLIKETLNELPPDLALLLINAIYFKGTWRTEFDAKNTSKAPFYAPGDTQVVDMMHIPNGDFAYFETDLFQAIDLPYGDSIFSMSIFLPKQGHDVGEIVAGLTPDSWNSWLSDFQTKTLSLFLPKFKLEYEKKLKRTLSTLGMERAFTSQADFSNMVSGGGVTIDEVFHKAFVEVDEQGTKAAAVTVVEIVLTSAGLQPEVNVNRPFFFVIRDNKTNSILFMGKVLKIA